jgi:hypothetical protein
MKVHGEYIVYACIFMALYYNWTNIPHPQPQREVRGILEKIQHESPH